MKSHLALLTALLIGIIGFSQQKNQIHLRSGAVSVTPGISLKQVDNLNQKIGRLQKAFLIIQFDELPSEFVKQKLASQGIELLNYVSDNAYTATVTRTLDANSLLQTKAKAIYQPTAQQKMDPSLVSGLFPSSAVKAAGTIDVSFSFPRTYSAQEVMAALKPMDATILSTDFIPYHFLNVRVPVTKIFQLAEQAFVEYVLPAPAPDQPLLNQSKILSHANVLNTSVANGGKGLKGEGVVIGHGDNADVQYHLDLKGRLINNTQAMQDIHGTHTAGIVAGGGQVQELYTGYAPRATIISNSFSNILINAPAYVQAYGMVVTNNSYGGSLGCDNNGKYDLVSSFLDKQAFDLPYLQHVFAAGNSGRSTCAPFAQGFRTVLSSYQSAKNVLTVGNTDENGTIAIPSSRGPVVDGRIKPEVTAQGTGVVSSVPGNAYMAQSGTSMAAPAVTGGAALLYQRYRQLHGNANPKSALIKALICNGATDKGNAGPDYKYGFGSMNLLRSITMLDSSLYFTNNATNNTTQTYYITVPANCARLKVMLYWHDPAPSLLAAKTLVNDLDLEVLNPSSAVILPLVLDSSAAHVDDAAVNAADHINNIEQVVINNPAAGNYTIRVKGTVAENPSQEYFVVYDVIPNSIKLTYPTGGEGIVPGEYIKIAWDAYGDETSTFSLQYSLDGGGSWTDIDNNIAAGMQLYSWLVPAVASDNALVRVTKNATGQSGISHPFAIIGVPSATLSSVQCESYININWPAVTGATDYEVMMLKGDEMSSIGYTTSTVYSFNSLVKDSTYLVTVRARINGKNGRRAQGIIRQPSDGNCSGAISDNDLKLNAILSPVSGRKFTSSELSATTAVTVEIKNLDDAPVTGFVVKYSVDGGTTWVSENDPATIAAGAVYTHTFTSTVNFSAVGNYEIIAVVKNNAGDVATSNDTLRSIVKHIDNQPLNLTTRFVDDLESVSVATYRADTIGLTGADRYDYDNANIYGRLRTFYYQNSGFAYSGSKAFTMDVDRFISQPNNTNNVIGTFNLSNYNATSKELRLDFRFKNHGTNNEDSSKVWIRGDDTKPWIEVYRYKNDKGIYLLSPSIELSDSLLKYGQNLSSSFQVKWTQWGVTKAVENLPAAGISIDDIRLYEALNDVQLQSVDSPYAYNCGMGNAVPIKITIHNGNKQALPNVPVKYSVNGGSWVTETLPSLPGDGTVSYVFSQKADLSKAGTYNIKCIVDYPGDNYRDNDTLTITIQNMLLITAFPFLENFENGDGGWYTRGEKTSWAYGTPSSPKINRAASGNKAWKTNLSGNYNDQERSYLYSPCLQIGALTNPTLSFSAAFDLEDCGNTACDGMSIQYSEDGEQWYGLIDTTNTAVNWYNKSNSYWSVENYTRWHVVTVPLPKGLNTIRLRFFFSSDPAVNREGVALDDFHVYDNLKGIYDGISTPPITQVITGGASWMHFEKDGKLIASIQPNNQNLGSTTVQAFIHAGTVRNTGTQYYHNRNITIKPSPASLTDSCLVRFYFTDSETEALLNASGCTGCTKPASAYELGISQYHDYDTSFENGSISDDLQGLWNFIAANKLVKVPFDKGYYAEFKVKDFSEFWLNNGADNKTTPLPVKLFNFSVQKTGSDANIIWTVGTESTVARYEIEVARNNADLQSGNFEKIGEAMSNGNGNTQQQYSFVDKEPFKSGARYYRIKTINQDGSYTYSVVRSLVFNAITSVQIVPNPSSGLFYLVCQANSGEAINIHVTDAIGKQIKTFVLAGTGYLQKINIDLGKGHAAGIYFVQLQVNERKETFKLYKK